MSVMHFANALVWEIIGPAMAGPTGPCATPMDTTGQTIANCVLDVLIRLQLPLSSLRGQTFDGASNMAGAYKRCQAIIGQRQPLALYTHCGSHCTNLAAEKVCSLGPLLRNSMQAVQEAGAVFSSSINLQKSSITYLH